MVVPVAELHQNIEPLQSDRWTFSYFFFLLISLGAIVVSGQNKSSQIAGQSDYRIGLKSYIQIAAGTTKL
jgi:hypothetical protein